MPLGGELSCSSGGAGASGRSHRMQNSNSDLSNLRGRSAFYKLFGQISVCFISYRLIHDVGCLKRARSLSLSLDSTSYELAELAL